MRIEPCFGCPMREGCTERDAYRSAASKTGAVAIRYRCTKLEGELRPGRRIVTTVPRLDADRDGELRRRGDHEVQATIVSASGPRFCCVVDPGEPGIDGQGTDVRPTVRFRRTMRHTRIRRFLTEPDAKVCKQGRVQRDTGCDFPSDSHCYCAAMEDNL